jgi:hypothetical protein
MRNSLQLIQYLLAMVRFGIDDDITYMRIGLQVLGSNIDSLSGKHIVDIFQHTGIQGYLQALHVGISRFTKAALCRRMYPSNKSTLMNCLSIESFFDIASGFRQI